jgi:hypothetical protein
MRMSQDNAANLSTTFALATYTAVADEYPTLIIPTVAD